VCMCVCVSECVVLVVLAFYAGLLSFLNAMIRSSPAYSRKKRLIAFTISSVHRRGRMN